MEQDIRWKQRFANYEKALKQLTNAIAEFGNDPVDIIKEGIIQRFEFTHELAWKVMKNYLEYEGFQNITGSRSATREAFNNGLLKDGETWMKMIESRNKTSHTYDEAVLESEFSKIKVLYAPLLQEFHLKNELFFMRFGLQEETIAKINSVFANYPEIETVIIYGSRAQGNYREGSDIDITLKGTGLTESILSKINMSIDGLNTPYLFDISLFDNLNSSDLKDHIQRVGNVFYTK